MIIRAIYPGTFDPVTNGHLDIIKRAAGLFAEVIVGVAANMSKNPRFTTEVRVAMIQESVAKWPNVQVKGFNGLLVDFAKEEQASVLVRGVRAVADFDYELALAGMNRRLNPLLDTVFLTPSEENMFISSTLVREVAALKGDIRAFVPEQVVRAFSACPSPERS